MKSLFLVVILMLALGAIDSRLIDREAVKDLFNDKVRDILDAPEADTSFDDKIGKRQEGEGEGGPGEKGPPGPVDEGEDKCDCDKDCPKMELPLHLLNESHFFQHETDPIDCRKGSRVYDKKDDKYLCEDLYDCCRMCNNHYFKCLKRGNNELGVIEDCLRRAYSCMCDCLEKNPPQLKEEK